MKKRKILMFALVLVIGIATTICLTGCGFKDNKTKNARGFSSASITLVVEHI